MEGRQAWRCSARFLLGIVGQMEPDHRVVPHLSLLIYKTSIWKDGDSRRPDLSIASKLTEDACSCCSVWQARCRY
jgi:hypothetical protein